MSMRRLEDSSFSSSPSSATLPLLSAIHADKETSTETTKYHAWPLTGIVEPSENDVIQIQHESESTRAQAHSPRYKELLSRHCEEYQTSSPLQRPILVMNIINEWRSQDPPGRYLKYSEKKRLWYDVGDKKARQWTNKALKELCSTLGSASANDALSAEKGRESAAPKEESDRSVANRLPASTETTTSPDSPTGGSNATVHEDASFSESHRHGIFSRSILDELHLKRWQHRVLLEAIENDSTRLVLVQGAQGTGKTHLVQSMLPSVRDDTWLMLGKFHSQALPMIPYAGFLTAISSWAALLSSPSQGHQAEPMQNVIRAKMGQDQARILADMIPTLDFLLDHDPSHAKAPAVGQRFVFCLKDFLGILCQIKPIVLVLDDVHSADISSLQLLTSIVCDAKIPNLTVILTCKPAMSRKSELAGRLREMEARGFVIESIQVDNLDRMEIESLLVNALSSPGAERSEMVEPFAELLMEQTTGNFLQLTRLLRHLQVSELLELVGHTWQWDVDEIKLSLDNVVLDDLLEKQIQALPRNVKEVLKVAACMGPMIDSFYVEKALGYSVAEALQVAMEQCLIVRKHSLELCFSNDSIKERVYEQIPSEERDLFHLEIGRRIWRRLHSRDVDRGVFVVLLQLQFGRTLITREKERSTVAQLCLHGGTKAARASAFATAIEILELGISFLSTRSWRDDYDLTLGLYTATAEMHMCSSSLNRMNELIEDIFRYARNYNDSIPAYATKLSALGASEKCREALDTGMTVLNTLGEPLPQKPSMFLFMKHAFAVKRMLKGKTNRQLMRLPLMTNQDKLACMQILHLIFLDASFSKQQLCPFIVLKLVRLTLEHGLSPFAAYGFSCYGVITLAVSGNIKEAYRYGELSLQLLDRFQAKEYIPRVHMSVYGVINPWCRPVAEALEPLLEAVAIGLHTGDIAAASHCAMLYTVNAMEAGRPLDSLNREVDLFAEMLAQREQKSTLAIMFVTSQTIHHSLGLTAEPLSAAGDVINFDEAFKVATELGQRTSAIIIPFHRMILAFYLTEYEQGAKYILQYHGNLFRVQPVSGKQSILFFTGMNSVSCARIGYKRRKHLRLFQKIIDAFKKLCIYSPHIMLDRLVLLQAEMASFRRQHIEANQKYLCAIALAEKNGIPQIKAVANEYFARHLYRNGDVNAAHSYFLDALSYYDAWKAAAKVQRFRTEIEKLYIKIPKLSRSITDGATTSFLAPSIFKASK